MSDHGWSPGSRVRVLWGADEGAVGVVIGDRGYEMTAIRVEVPDGFLELTVDDVMLGPEDDGGGGVREPREPIGPDGSRGAQEPMPW
jgi:hypothetical protein